MPHERAKTLREALTEPERGRAQEKLAASLHTYISRRLRKTIRNEADREDLAQQVALDVFQRIVAGHVEPGREDAYAARAAQLRSRRGLQKAMVGRARDRAVAFRGAPGDEPEDDSPNAFARLEHREQAELVRQALEQAPERYREVIEQHYLAERPLAELLDPGSDRRKAEQRLYKQRERAVMWLRSQLAAGLQGEQP